MSSKEQAINEINALRLYPEFKIEQQDANLWRINGAYDLYPSTRRIYPVADSSRYTGWKRGELLQKIRHVIKHGINQKTFDLVEFIGGKRHKTVAAGLNYGACAKEKLKREASGQYKRVVLRIVPCS